MSREKASEAACAAAWLPTMAAFAMSGLPRVAASRPSSRPAVASRLLRASPAMRRAMWRWVTWDSSCPSTEASSSREEVIAIRPRCTPTKPPGSAKA